MHLPSGRDPDDLGFETNEFSVITTVVQLGVFFLGEVPLEAVIAERVKDGGGHELYTFVVREVVRLRGLLQAFPTILQ